MQSRKRVVILGATGSIGGSALRVIRQHPDRLQLVGVSANRSTEALAAIVAEFGVARAVLSNGASESEAQTFPAPTRLASGAEALCELASLPEADTVLVALVGAAGLLPTIAAIRAGKTVVLANKEVLVMAGDFIMKLARDHQVAILPADSEHNAIFQCLHSDLSRLDLVEKVILTASGGPFRETPLEDMASITPQQALRHPNWEMGAKISLDSATMANKGLELIEARWLFGLEPARLEVVIHPQSLIHGMIRFRDGSVLAQLSPADMAFPIQHCLLFPERAGPPAPTLDWSAGLDLRLEPPDERRFPCLALARHAMETGQSAPCVFNAANEEAGKAFLEGRIPFAKIPWIIDKTLEKASIEELASLDAILANDTEARTVATQLIHQLA